MNKYEIEKVTYGDGAVRYFVLKNGKRENTLVGLPFKFADLEEARQYIENAKERDARQTVVTREIVE